MHMRTFKAKAAAKFQAANPGFSVVDTIEGPNRFQIPQPFRGYLSADEREAIAWGVWVQRGNDKRRAWLHWSAGNGFWMT